MSYRLKDSHLRTYQLVRHFNKMNPRRRQKLFHKSKFDLFIFSLTTKVNLITMYFIWVTNPIHQNSLNKIQGMIVYHSSHGSYDHPGTMLAQPLTSGFKFCNFTFFSKGASEIVCMNICSCK